MILCWSLTKIRFVQNAGLANAVIIAIFVCKIMAGLVNGWLTHFTPEVDTWKYHSDGLIEYHLLFSNPKEYFTNLFYTGYSYAYEGVLQTQHSYWNDLKTNLMIKLVSVFHVFSGGNYYVNVILYNFLAFFGHIALYRAFREVYKARPWLLICVVFLLPSLLYFSSAIHKEGLMLAAIGIIVFNVQQGLHHTGFGFRRWAAVVLPLCLVFLLRNYVVFALLPALAGWVLAKKIRVAPVLIFLMVYLVAAVVFFNLHKVFPAVNLPAYMVQKQSDFFELEKANTAIPLHTLQPHFTSYVKNAAQALQHVLCRPFFSDAVLSKFLLPFSVELLFYGIVILAFFFLRKTAVSFNHPFVLFGFFFALSVCLIVGYTVPVIGAIVRYRAIYLPFLIAPFLLQLDWDKILRLIKIKK
jgi:hypothetical protein